MMQQLLKCSNYFLVRNKFPFINPLFGLFYLLVVLFNAGSF